MVANFSMVLLIFLGFSTVISAAYYHNLPYSTKTIQSQLQARRNQEASKMSPPPTAHLFVLRPDYALRNINKVADVFRNFLQKRLLRPTDDLKRAAIVDPYDY